MKCSEDKRDKKIRARIKKSLILAHGRRGSTSPKKPQIEIITDNELNEENKQRSTRLSNMKTSETIPIESKLSSLRGTKSSFLKRRNKSKGNEEAFKS